MLPKLFALHRMCELTSWSSGNSLPHKSDTLYNSERCVLQVLFSLNDVQQIVHHNIKDNGLLKLVVSEQSIGMCLYWKSEQNFNCCVGENHNGSNVGDSRYFYQDLILPSQMTRLLLEKLQCIRQSWRLLSGVVSGIKRTWNTRSNECRRNTNEKKENATMEDIVCAKVIKTYQKVWVLKTTIAQNSWTALQ